MNEASKKRVVLQEFVEAKHWAHFDIAGVMDNSANAIPYLNKGMSGTRPSHFCPELNITIFVSTFRLATNFTRSVIANCCNVRKIRCSCRALSATS